MNSQVSKPKPTPNLYLTALITGSLTLAQSVIYLVLCIVALISRFDCNVGAPDSVSGSGYFLNIVYRAYIQDSACANAINVDGITGDYSVFVLVAITLSAAFVSLIAAIILMSAVTSDGLTPYLSIIVYGYVGVYVASLAVDITLAAHFGMDYSFLSSFLNESSPGLSLNYERDMIRIGAFILMTISLKAFIGHIINIVLIVLLVMYLILYTEILDKHEHSIHKLGAIEAYDSRRPREPSHPNQRDSYQPPRGPQMNYGYMNDEEAIPRSPMRDGLRSDYPRNGFDRSNSWQLGPGSAGRPFSYLEEGKRPMPVPVRPPASPAVEPSWRDPWRANAPPVPAPDYSPTAPRRLKSALKSGYM
ncbi:hypothetical protein ABMA28_000308 [Loxostege sticticalis]|uniref:Uncharacterized protein n=1 Tax=Loxostege sticticalis TaxID=481309 RepID=A0ABD0TS86_LOXSC